jgi:sugar phosphate isomerase/epimerase
VIELGFETIQFSPKFGEPPTLPELLRAAKSSGFSWIALDRHTAGRSAPNRDALGALAEALSAAELPCRALQSLRLTADPTQTRPGNLLDQVEMLKPDVVPLIFFVDPNAAVLERTCLYIDQILGRYAAVRFAIEFSPLFPVPDVASALRVRDRLAHPAVGLLLDTWHIFNGPTNWDDLEALTPEEVALVQINDHGVVAASELTRAKDHRLLPGDGVFPLPRFIRQLHDIRYDGLVSVEVISEDLRRLGPAQFAESAYAATSRLLDTTHAIQNGHSNISTTFGHSRVEL